MRLRGTNFCTSSAYFAPSFVRQPNGPKTPKWYETHQNMSLGSSGVDRVRSWRKIPMQLRDTNFCTSSARFALSFVRQPNSLKCIQIVQNTPKYEFRVQWGGSGALLRKIPTRLRGTNFCTSLARFALNFVTQPNGPKCIQIVQNTPKHEFRVRWGGSVAFVAKKFRHNFVARTFAPLWAILH